jgi:sigma-B regulation protein RsbU (phosphoserine phosphatase)
MEQPRYSFKWRWALSSIAVGVIATTAYALGADQLPSGQMLFGGGLVGLSIYAISEVLNGLFGRHIAELRPALRAPARILFGVVAGFGGWVLGFVVAALIFTGRPHVAETVGPGERSLLLIALAITILFGALAHGYDELRCRLTASVEQLKEREFEEKELEVAREIQSRLLPPPRIEGDGFLITARNLPAHFVAGDFFDVLRHEDGSVGIVIADVSGKGLGASLIMASVKAVLPFVASGSVDETLQKLNERLASQLGRREFVALAYARFHPDTGKLQLANAGMPDPYVITASSATAISVNGGRLPLGVRNDVRYESVEVQLQRGDRFFLLSDGIPEAPRANGEPLGYDALRDMLTGIADDDRWIDTLLERVRAQVQSIDDDWTAVVLERV